MIKENTKIIEQFEKLADQISVQINSSINKKEQLTHGHRLRQIKNVIKILKNYPKKITSGEELKDIKGIGKHSVDRINEILKTDKLSEIKFQKKSKKELEYIEELEKIINIGRKTAIDLVKQENIKSIKELKKAHKEGKIELNNKILLGLKYYDKHKGDIPRKETMKIETLLKQTALRTNKELFIIICGSYRRLKITSNDIDVLLTHPKIKTMKDLKKLSVKDNYLRKFVMNLKKQGFILDDLTDKNFIHKYMGFCRYDKNPIRRIDIRFVPNESYYPALLYFTGSGSFNRKMRELANSLGYKLNEYGLYTIGTDTKVKVKSEKDIFDRLGMEYIEPENRV